MEQMSLFDSELENAIRERIKIEAGSPVIDTPWLCDVFAANTEIIRLHNDYWRETGRDIEAKFEHYREGPCTLNELLQSDFRYVFGKSVLFESLAQEYLFVEIAGAIPNAHHISFHIDNRVHQIICFRSPLLWFVHSTFSKLQLMLSTVHADCLPCHDHLLEGESYTDASLLAALYNDIEVFFDQRLLQRDVTPPHLGSPYNYCEKVEGARRFMLGHELGHSIYPLIDEPDLLVQAAETMSAGYDLPPAAASSWAEELWCDQVAVLCILNLYDDVELNAASLYELENALIGILSFFTILDIVGGALSLSFASASHPPTLLRRDIVRRVIKLHPVYLRSQQLQKTLPANWGLLNAFWGIVLRGDPDGHRVGSFASMWRFFNGLNEFGQRAFDAAGDYWIENELARSLAHSEWEEE